MAVNALGVPAVRLRRGTHVTEHLCTNEVFIFKKYDKATRIKNVFSPLEIIVVAAKLDCELAL